MVRIQKEYSMITTPYKEVQTEIDSLKEQGYKVKVVEHPDFYAKAVFFTKTS